MLKDTLLLDRIMTSANGELNLTGINLWITLSGDNMTAALSEQVEQGVERRLVQQAINKILRDKGIKHGLSAAEMR